MSTDRPSTRHDSTVPGQDVARLTAWLTGEVQGVGMRWWVRARALELGLAGSATNRADGRVEIVAEGPRTALKSLLDLLGGAAAAGRPGSVRGVTEQWGEPRDGMVGFQER